MNNYDTLGVGPSQRRFHLDEDLLPDAIHYHDNAAYINHGRCVVRNHAGRWITAVAADRGMRSGNWLTLHVSDDDRCLQGSQFPEPIFLLGPSVRGMSALFPDTTPTNVALALTANDQLHVIVEIENTLQCFTAAAAGPDIASRLSDKANWQGPRTLMDNAQLGDALIDGDGNLVVFAIRAGDLYQCVDGNEPTLVAPDAIHPSVFIEQDGTTHVAFERDRRVYYTKTINKQWAEPQLVAHWCSSWPSLVVTGGQVLIVYQGEGKVELKRYRDLSESLRPGGGSTVSFAYHDGKRWTQTDYLRSSQIMLKRKTSAGMANHDEIFEPFMEEFWRPSLSIDRHGVAWMFYVNTTRRHVFFARWQGESFGPHHEARGGYDCLSRIVLIQKDARQSDDIGYMTLATQRFYFDAIRVPNIEANTAKRVVFLDNLEVDRAINLEHRIGKWQKNPEPVFGFGLPGGCDNDQIMWCHVEPVEGGYEMHYMGWGEGSGATRATTLPGRAFSADGYNWEKRPHADNSDLTLDGKNVGEGFWHPVGMRDDDEPDPQKRYKGLHVDWQYDAAGLVQVRTYKVVASPDGRNWHTVPDLPGVVLGDIVTALQLLRDDEDEDPNRRYKITLTAGSNSGRGMAVFTSPDLLHWSKVNYLRIDTDDVASPLSTFPTGPLAIDPDASENPWEEEIHDAVIWRENGHLMFHYDAFYFGNNQHIEKALAVSRDGRHYWRILRGAINMPHGACGDWDSGRDRSALPVRVGDEYWMWFAAGPASDYNDPEEDANGYFRRLRKHAGSPGDIQKFRELRPWRVGLAKLRVDGWAYMQLEREAEQGELTTIDFETAGDALIVNGSHLGSELAVELLNESGHVVEGYSRNDCTFSDSDSVNARVTWKGGSLPRGTHRLRFVFTGLRAKLYAFGIA